VNTLSKKTLGGRDHLMHPGVGRKIILKLILVNRSTGCKGVDWIQLVHNRVWKGGGDSEHENKSSDSTKLRIFLTNWVIVNFLNKVEALLRNIKCEGTRGELATATQPQFPRIVISLS
jgi:hypothetical protein